MYFAISGVKFCFQLIAIRKQPSIVYLCQYLCWKIICSKCQCSAQKVLKIQKFYENVRDTDFRCAAITGQPVENDACILALNIRSITCFPYAPTSKWWHGRKTSKHTSKRRSTIHCTIRGLSVPTKTRVVKVQLTATDVIITCNHGLLTGTVQHGCSGKW